MGRFVAPIMLGMFTVLAIVLLTSDNKSGDLAEVFDLQAEYDSGVITVTYVDNSKKTESATLEVLGMEESFQKTFGTSEFKEAVQFGDPPRLGWKVHPVVVSVEHSDLGKVEIKTEIRAEGDPEPKVIYSRQ